ncbi:MAG: helicase-related protein [Alphaproteobacteria bacterium]
MQGSAIRAILGPTNTGKTYLAVERMLGHATGMIGFPLRLLARENYDRIADRVGASSVALITGEEKILPPNPRFLVCTVEAMPLDRTVDFLAIDEIQLCADPERGHVFTDRLLHARGRQETMFLGSDSMTGLIQTLIPDVRVETRPRLSTLTWAGTKKLSRLKRRSAVVAFSVGQVYELAEAVRQTRGGTAVVLGALSPRTRNAQVEMYQAGEVDYLVATDAIGMGLNMDVDHVAFAQLAKFDGARRRPLTAPEIGQIAGRAGRHMNDGTFGVTNTVKPPDEEIIRRVEEHDYQPVKEIFWRNRRLDFASPKRLYASLNDVPDRPELVRAREAEDQYVLASLMQDPEILKRAETRDRVQLLWDVCQIPDFRKVMPDHHASMVGQIFTHLSDRDGQLPEDYVAGQIERLDRVDGDIDTLTARLAHVRTWTYIAHRADWVREAANWQARTRQIEDQLSDALHQRLTDRFVDRRAATLGRARGRDGVEMLSAVNKKNEVIVEGHVVGRLDGLRFIAQDAADRREEKALMAAAMRALGEHAPILTKEIEDAPDQSFGMSPDGKVTWRGRAVAGVEKGASILSPRAVLLRNDIPEDALNERIRVRLQKFVDGFLGRRLGALIETDRLAGDLSPAGRGLLYQLREGLGSLTRRDAATGIKALNESDRQALTTHGLRMGRDWVYLSGLLDIKAVRARAILWAAWTGNSVPETPNSPAPGLSSVLAPPDAWPFLGYCPAGPVALRLDRWERIAAEIRNLKPESGIVADTGRLQALGLAPGDRELILGVFRALGLKAADEAADPLTFIRGKRQRKAKAASKKRPPRTDKVKTDRRRPDPDSPFAVLKTLVQTK